MESCLSSHSFAFRRWLNVYVNICAINVQWSLITLSMCVTHQRLKSPLWMDGYTTISVDGRIQSPVEAVDVTGQGNEIYMDENFT